jgi:CRP/FNR family cyclic AMP-dependent transcriptional regulator
MPPHTYAPRSFLQSLGEPDREALLGVGRRRAWQRGEIMIRRGDPADSAIVLLEGVAKIHNAGPEGTEVVLGLSGPGDLLGEISAVRDATRAANATALEPIRAAVLPTPELRTFLSRHPRATLALLELVVGRLNTADARRIEFATSETLGRVSSRLIELAERFGERRSDGTVDVGLPINQQELASWSASSLESTARALRTLRGLGLIETRRLRLTVRDLDQLRSHAPRI